MSTPNAIPVIAYIVIVGFIAFTAYGYFRTGKLLELFIPDNSGKFGNSYLRELIDGFLLFYSSKSSNNQISSFDELSIHEDIKITAFEQEFAKYHSTIVRDAADLWIMNSEYQMGMTFSFVVNYLLEKTFGDLSNVPGCNEYKQNVTVSIEQIAGQYDWKIADNCYNFA
jgi:hypothetical protein